MITTIQKWGNSKAVRIPKPILEKTNINEFDTVEITAEQDTILIRKVSQKYKKLDDLFHGYTGSYCCKECDSGTSVGKEEL